MGQLVFQATLGGQVNLVGPNTASTFNINIPAFTGTMASLASVTTNGVTYVNSSGQPTTGSAITFDGTNFATTGTASATKLIPTGSSVTGNGLYLPATNSLGLSTNGTNAVYIDASQNVGIGTTALSSGVRLYASNATSGAPATSGTTQASGALRIRSGSNAICDFGVGAGAGTTTWIQAADQTGLNTNYDIAMQPNGGNLLVGTTNTSATAGVGMKFIFSVDATNPVIKSVMTDSSGAYSTYNLYCTNASAYRFYVTTTGVVNATTTTITAISDQRLKENIRDLDDGLEKVLALKPRKFDWKENKGENIKNARGFIAQELELVFPDMISNWIDEPPEGEEPYKAVNANLIPSLVKAIQEQQALITALTARITALEAK